MKYKGYEITPSTRPGKAVRGYKKTNTMQIRRNLNFTHYILEKEIRYEANNKQAEKGALEKAKLWVDETQHKPNSIFE